MNAAKQFPALATPACLSGAALLLVLAIAGCAAEPIASQPPSTTQSPIPFDEVTQVPAHREGKQEVLF